jgi:hypothetical protein
MESEITGTKNSTDSGMASDPLNLIITGVGGQGNVLASQIPVPERRACNEPHTDFQ